MMKEEIQKLFRGEVLDDEGTLRAYSHDASLFEVRPRLVVYPKNSQDLQSLVKWVNECRHSVSTSLETRSVYKDLSITVRAAGSDMSGGPLNESIVADVTKHMDHISRLDLDNITVQPGVFYRDFEKITLEKGLILPCYPASKNLCALGGMIGNNCAGEKTLRYGKMENYVEELTVVLRDGEIHTFRAIPRAEALRKSHEHGLEGEIYQYLYNLLDKNRELIAEEKPKVSKNSAGYYLWNVERNGLFDINRLLVGSQGTLGIVTKAKIKLVPVEKYSKLFVIFMKDLKPLGDL